MGSWALEAERGRHQQYGGDQEDPNRTRDSADRRPSPELDGVTGGSCPTHGLRLPRGVGARDEETSPRRAHRADPPKSAIGVLARIRRSSQMLRRSTY